MGKDPDSKIQKSKKSKNYRGAPKVLDFLDLHCVFGVFWIFQKKKLMFFFGFSRFCFWKILKIQKNYCFFWIFRLFLKNPKKQKVFFYFIWVLLEKSKKTYVFFGCSRFLLLENLENPKKPIVFFCDFSGFS